MTSGKPFYQLGASQESGKLRPHVAGLAVDVTAGAAQAAIQRLNKFYFLFLLVMLFAFQPKPNPSRIGMPFH